MNEMENTSCRMWADSLNEYYIMYWQVKEIYGNSISGDLILKTGTGDIFHLTFDGKIFFKMFE